MSRNLLFYLRNVINELENIFFNGGFGQPGKLLVMTLNFITYFFLF